MVRRIGRDNTLEIAFCGLGIRLRLGSAYLRDAFATVLQPFLCSRLRTIDLETRVVDKETFLKERERWSPNMEKIGRRVFRGGETIYVEQFVDFPGISIALQERDGKLIMTAFIENLRQHCRDDKNVFQCFLPYLFYYPAFWLLEQKKQVFPLHGGGIQYKGRGVIFAGLQGVGKSTLILTMLREPSARFLSDNLYLHSGTEVFACPETIRLDDASVRFIGETAGILKNTRYRSDYGRRMYVIEDRKSVQRFEPDMLLIPSFSNETRLARISAGRAAKMVLSFNELALELRSYHQFAAPFTFLSGAKDKYIHRHKVLARFLRRLPIYELKIKPDGRMDRSLSLIESALHV